MIAALSALCLAAVELVLAIGLLQPGAAYDWLFFAFVLALWAQYRLAIAADGAGDGR